MMATEQDYIDFVKKYEAAYAGNVFLWRDPWVGTYYMEFRNVKELREMCVLEDVSEVDYYVRKNGYNLDYKQVWMDFFGH